MTDIIHPRRWIDSMGGTDRESFVSPADIMADPEEIDLYRREVAKILHKVGALREDLSEEERSGLMFGLPIAELAMVHRLFVHDTVTSMVESGEIETLESFPEDWVPPKNDDLLH